MIPLIGRDAEILVMSSDLKQRVTLESYDSAVKRIKKLTEIGLINESSHLTSINRFDSVAIAWYSDSSYEKRIKRLTSRMILFQKNNACVEYV